MNVNALTVRQKTASVDTLFERWYPGLLLSLWVLVPEVRRLVDWQVGFNRLPVIQLIPIVALLPLAAVVARTARQRVSYGFKIAAWLWVAGFGYALLLGCLAGRLFGAVYECSLFILPLLIGVWLATMAPARARRIFERFVDAALWLAVITSLYGIYQYIAPPPWDAYWMVNSGLASIGNPYPFEVRVFSTLNAPLPFADFIAITILLALHRLRLKNIWLIVPLLVCIAALILSLVRTAWLEVAVGVIVFVCLSPRRAVVAGTTVFALVLTFFVATNLALITGNPQVANEVQDRLATFNDLQNDASADSRVNGSATTLHQSLEEPLGTGLGYSAGAKLAGARTVTAASTYGADNGFLERFLEMGVFGFALYLASIGASFVLSFTGLRRSLAAGDDASATLFATFISIQVGLMGANSSADALLSLMAIFYWMVAGLSSTLTSELPSRAAFGIFGSEPDINRPARAR